MNQISTMMGVHTVLALLFALLGGLANFNQFWKLIILQEIKSDFFIYYNETNGVVQLGGNTRSPYVSETIPTDLLMIIVLLVPTLIFTIVPFLIGASPSDNNERFVSRGCKKIKYAAYDVWLGLVSYIEGFGVTLMLVGFAKVMTGRPRPYFEQACNPVFDPNPDNTARQFTCANTDISSDVYASFPSGHAALSMYAAAFVILYVAGSTGVYRHTRYDVDNERKDVYQMCRSALHALFVIVFVVFGGIALYVGISRITDYRHNPEDVLGGALIGLAIAISWYFLFYYAPCSPQSGRSKILPKLDEEE